MFFIGMLIDRNIAVLLDNPNQAYVSEHKGPALDLCIMYTQWTFLSRRASPLAFSFALAC